MDTEPGYVKSKKELKREEKARQRHFKRMAGEVCGSGVAASIFVDILGTLERIGDHIWNIVKEGNEEAMTLDLRPNETDD